MEILKFDFLLLHNLNKIHLLNNCYYIFRICLLLLLNNYYYYI
nr:MAG TPA: hypothetical protein [Bacteriophage sp.]